MTGTPLSRGLEDLFGLLAFLQVPPGVVVCVRAGPFIAGVACGMVPAGGMRLAPACALCAGTACRLPSLATGRPPATAWAPRAPYQQAAPYSNRFWWLRVVQQPYEAGSLAGELPAATSVLAAMLCRRSACKVYPGRHTLPACSPPSAAARARLLALLKPSLGGLLWRSAKADVAHELGLPPQV